MKFVGMTLLLLALSLLAPLPATANTPGQHKVTLSWTASTGPCGTGCVYNIYKTTAGAKACTGVSNPTPYITSIVGLTVVDTTGLNDGETVNYNISAVRDGGTGGEGSCDTELQLQIPVLPAAPPLVGTAQ